MDWIVALVTLTVMEIVLGIDNIVFISILCGKLPERSRAMARTFGLGLAMGTRIVLLLSLTWVLGLTTPVFYLTDLGIPAAWVESPQQTTARLQAESSHQSNSTSEETSATQTTADNTGHHAEVPGEHDVNAVSYRDIILLLGGLFLIANSVVEIHHKLEGQGASHATVPTSSMWVVIVQIGVLDIIFSLDSVITAIGMTDHLNVMIVAVVIAIIVMMIFAGTIERFIQKYPTIKVLALSFLILIGVLLVAEGIGNPVNKGYIYFAMAFSLAVELINMQIRGGRGVPTDPEELLPQPTAQ